MVRRSRDLMLVLQHGAAHTLEEGLKRSLNWAICSEKYFQRKQQGPFLLIWISYAEVAIFTQMLVNLLWKECFSH